MLKKFLNRLKKKSDDSKILEIKEKITDIPDKHTPKDIDNLDKITNIQLQQLNDEDKLYIKDIKIKRGKSIKAINIYTNEEQVFETHKQCSKALKVPIQYIKENLRYGHTDYLGEAIKYLSKELKLSELNNDYINNNKSPLQIYNKLNNKIFTLNISESKKDEILSNNKIEPIKMHYKFECLDEEYENYYRKYKHIIKRGGKKKIELLNSKGEVIEVFKSLDECSKYFNKSKSQITTMLKYKENKIGRYEIRYSLRNI